MICQRCFARPVAQGFTECAQCRAFAAVERPAVRLNPIDVMDLVAYTSEEESPMERDRR